MNNRDWTVVTSHWHSIKKIVAAQEAVGSLTCMYYLIQSSEPPLACTTSANPKRVFFTRAGASAAKEPRAETLQLGLFGVVLRTKTCVYIYI